MGAPAGAMPPWFERFLRAVFYVPCPVHRDNRKWCNLYCTDCMTPVCSDCRDDGGSHCRRHNHLILQVVRSSYQAAVQIDGTNGIGKLFGGDDDDIQVYRANRGHPYLCRACSWPLLDADKRFCSISCKLMPEEEPRRRLHHCRDPSYPVPLGGGGGFDGDEGPVGGELGGGRRRLALQRSLLRAGEGGQAEGEVPEEIANVLTSSLTHLLCIPRSATQKSINEWRTGKRQLQKEISTAHQTTSFLFF
ncbi:unnamed protein product [Spirodela intermedia]|uniref:B box-type domain-containing protein n=1 Tax=Spirodela intermedia TaxID=51605 RepID=A0A7I8ILB3_SPIIN|nr:unnamed protein product [Spirodela intermedia]CAA6657728.1 unnamed protein product [Spirodela intermedia]